MIAAIILAWKLGCLSQLSIKTRIETRDCLSVDRMLRSCLSQLSIKTRIETLSPRLMFFQGHAGV